MTEPCPSQEQLARMISETHEGAEPGVVERHVAGCLVCQQVLERLTAGESRSTFVRRDDPLQEDHPPTEHFSFLARLEQAPPTMVSPAKDEGAPDAQAVTGNSGAIERPPVTMSWPTIPGYEIQGELGRGGMGVIYLARQLRANRLVALKMIQNSGRGRPENLLRFSLEGETLARLRHPNIVQIYEVGAHDGQPFLSMEYVEGGNLSEAMARHPLTTRRAAALVETLAHAVHAAHQGGIIHRDLKPANVLLSPPTGTSGDPPGQGPWHGSPKITDFGLAKRLGSDSGLTDTGQILGTPSYMAPEQAVSGAPVGVPADVYALGAILYALITGRPPFQCASTWETMMQVVHQPATPPSQHRKGISRDLETISLKCLEKEPGKRYPSADALAEDLRRHLAREPIAARPVGPATRLVMWCRRKPAVASMAAALLLVFLAGFAGVVTQWVRAERNSRAARNQERRAAGNYRLAREAVDDTLTRISENRLFNEPGLQALRKELLTSALRYYQEFVKFQGDDPSAKVELMGAYTRLGTITQEIGSIEEAKAFFLTGLESTQALAEVQPYNAALMTGRAETFLALSKAQFLSRQVAEAMKTVEEAVTIYRALDQAYPGDTKIRLGLAGSLTVSAYQQSYAGKLAEAESRFRNANTVLDGLTDRKARRALATNLTNLGDTLARSPGRMKDSIGSFRASIEIRKALAHDAPDDFWARYDLADCYLKLGDFLLFLNQWAESLELILLARDLLDPLVRENPRVTSLRYELGLANYVAGSAFLGVGRHDEALASYQQALDHLGQVARENPTEERYQSPGLSGIHLSIGELYRSLGDLAPSIRSMRASLKIQEGVTLQNPTSLMNQVNLGMVHRSIGSVQAESGDAPAAIESARRALEILDQIQPKSRQNIMVLSELYQGRLTMGAAQRKGGHASEALRWYRQAEADLSGLSSQDPSSVEYQTQLGLCHCRISALERALGRTGDAVRSWEDARTIVEKFPHDVPDRLFILALVRSLHIPLIAREGVEGERARREEGDRATEALKRAVALGFKNVIWLNDDPDLEPIRSRADFQALVRSLPRPSPAELPRAKKRS
jgi:eukaryotic-like serine/threonine-protein kinase